MGIITNKLNEFDTLEKVSDLVTKINEKLPKREDCKIYTNQMICAINGIKMFDSNLPRPNHLVINGKTQAGKTGVLTSMIMLIGEMKIEDAMSINAIYYITGDNGCRLIRQTKERIQQCFAQNNIGCSFYCLKNSDLKKQIGNNTELNHAIIFIDESHYGVSNEKNVLIRWLESHGLNMHNDKELVDKSIYIVSNSATPYGEINSDCGKFKSYVSLETDDWNGTKGYVGFKEFNEKNCFVPKEKNSFISKNNQNDTEIRNICMELESRLKEIEHQTGKRKCGVIRMGKRTYERHKNILDEYFLYRAFFWYK